MKLLFFFLFALFGFNSLTAEELPYSKVVLIVVDTLRADHLPMYGYKKNTAPFLASLADRTIVFENAISTSSYTAPATASIHTALLPDEHGVIIGLNATKRMSKVDTSFQLNRVPQKATTIAEFMKANDYQTFGIADNGNISKAMGFDQGFDHFVTFTNEGSKNVNEQALAWHEMMDKSSKYFLYLHYMDPHSPYEKHAPWYDESAKGAQEKLVASYDSEINNVDEKIKELFTKFGWGRDTLIVLSADHGEEFWEHGKTGHGKTLYHEVLHVPLLIYSDKTAPNRVPDLVSNADIPPTIASLTGLGSFAKTVSYPIFGIDLIEESKATRTVLSNLHKETKKGRSGRMDAMTKPDWKFIVSKDTSSATVKVEQRELFARKTDPLEKHNSFKKNKDIGLSLEAELDSMLQAETPLGRELAPYQPK
ncbi:MAG: sulfatase [Bdellovibrionales bacterium]|nr:sulfatase [Bdellovibrionales bacterium]